MEELLKHVPELLVTLMQSFPILSSVIVWVGVARLIFKPLQKLVGAIVEATTTKSDDALWLKIKDHWAYKGFAYLLDYLGSVKLPK